MLIGIGSSCLFGQDMFTRPHDEHDLKQVVHSLSDENVRIGSAGSNWRNGRWLLLDLSCYP
jgi:hypothetical protein